MGNPLNFAFSVLTILFFFMSLLALVYITL